MVWPLVQEYKKISLTPMTIPIPLDNALSLQNIRINVPSTFTVGVSTNPLIMANAAERLLHLAKDDIEEMAKEIILGQLRLTVASLTIEQINQDREAFLRMVSNNVDTELHKIGLYLINVNITDITDEALKASRLKDVIGVLAGRIFNWGQRKSLFPLHLGIKCCALEMAAAGASRFDAERFGVFFRSSPRQCDVLLVNGPISKKFADPIVRLWEQMPEPKWCIAMGECAISGGPYFQSYNILEGVDTIIPVDVYIPGCPPRPEALIDGFGKLREKIIRIGAMPSHSRLESEAPIIVGDI